MPQREEILDMAVHALTPLMRARTDASPESLFDESLDIGQELVAKVEATAAQPGTPSRDELVDMGVHALSALLNGRGAPPVDDLLDECMAVAQSIIARVDAELGPDADDDAREELLDMAVHVQTAFLSARPRMDADALSDQCVSVARALIARIDKG